MHSDRPTWRLNHQSLKDDARNDPSRRSEVYKNFERINQAGDVIVRSVAIPPLHEDVPVSAELTKEA